MDGIPQDRLHYVKITSRSQLVQPKSEPMLTTEEWVHHFALHQLLIVVIW